MAGKLTATDKALHVNLEGTHYGTFAEIGAGQEVARHFFLAGKASNTLAKTMSAYDMTFSDEIYGREPSGRYVCESRVQRMLDHEYKLVDERLKKERGTKNKFFAYANTVATNAKAMSRCHGWMGVRYQADVGGPINEIVMHVHMRDNLRLLQQEALGILGVNLIYAAFFVEKNPETFVAAMFDNIHRERIEIDMIRCSGPDLKHVDNHLLALELVKQGLTQAVLFNKESHVVQASDVLFNRDVLVQRGKFRPITNTNLKILEYGLKQFKSFPETKDSDPMVFLEMTMNDLVHEGDIDVRDFLDRIELISSLGHNVLISSFSLFFQLKEYLRKLTPKHIGMVVGANSLNKLYDEKFYKNVTGGMLDAFGKLFDSETHLLVYPYKTSSLCLTAETFSPDGASAHLHKFLLQSHSIIDILGCDDVDTEMHSEQVREFLAKGDGKWETIVPKKVAEIIKAKRLFGYKR